MQTSDFKDFSSSLLDEIGKDFVSEPQNRIEAVCETVAKRLEQIVADGKLMTLDADEVSLLIAYRAWKCRPDSATGVFHFRKP